MIFKKHRGWNLRGKLDLQDEEEWGLGNVHIDFDAGDQGFSDEIEHNGVLHMGTAYDSPHRRELYPGMESTSIPGTEGRLLLEKKWKDKEEEYAGIPRGAGR